MANRPPWQVPNTTSKRELARRAAILAWHREHRAAELRRAAELVAAAPKPEPRRNPLLSPPPSRKRFAARRPVAAEESWLRRVAGMKREEYAVTKKRRAP
jgi:hypothetical protein